MSGYGRRAGDWLPHPRMGSGRYLVVSLGGYLPASLCHVAQWLRGTFPQGRNDPTYSFSQKHWLRVSKTRGFPVFEVGISWHSLYVKKHNVCGYYLVHIHILLLLPIRVSHNETCVALANPQWSMSAKSWIENWTSHDLRVVTESVCDVIEYICPPNCVHYSVWSTRYTAVF